MVQVSVFLVRCGETQVEEMNALNDAAPDDGIMLNAGEDDAVLEYDDDDDDSHSSANSNQEEVPTNNMEAPASPSESHNQEHEQDLFQFEGGSKTPKTPKVGMPVGSLAAKTPKTPKTPGFQAEDVDQEETTTEQQQQATANQQQQPVTLRLSQRVDPFLTLTGYQQAQHVLTHLLAGLAASTDEERRLAGFCAPTKAAAGSALMWGSAGLGQYTNLRWQLATVPCLEAPFAVPVVVHNPLAAAEAEIAVCGGDVPVTEAGLLHCAAKPWNDARNKCPFGLVLKQMKQVVYPHIRAWKDEKVVAVATKDDDASSSSSSEENEDPNTLEKQNEQEEEEEKDENEEEKEEEKDENGDELQQQQQQQQPPASPTKKPLKPTKNAPRRCIDVQYLHVHNMTDPWSLQDLTMKTNILVEFMDPARYNTPPRRGKLHPKPHVMPDRPGAYFAVQQAAWWARQVGCDAIVVLVGQAAMQELAKTAGLLQHDDTLEVPAASLASLVATCPDETTTPRGKEVHWRSHEANAVEFAFHGFYTAQELEADPAAAIPPYAGQVDILVEPPANKDPMTIPVNQWSKFPLPQPENIPADYPDLPPFSQALTQPVPKRWRPPEKPKPDSPRKSSSVSSSSPRKQPQQQGSSSSSQQQQGSSSSRKQPPQGPRASATKKKGPPRPRPPAGKKKKSDQKANNDNGAAAAKPADTSDDDKKDEPAATPKEEEEEPALAAED